MKGAAALRDVTGVSSIEAATAGLEVVLLPPPLLAVAVAVVDNLTIETEVADGALVEVLRENEAVELPD